MWRVGRRAGLPFAPQGAQGLTNPSGPEGVMHSKLSDQRSFPQAPTKAPLG